MKAYLADVTAAVTRDLGKLARERTTLVRVRGQWLQATRVGDDLSVILVATPYGAVKLEHDGAGRPQYLDIV